MDGKKLGKRNRLSTSPVVIAHVQWIKTSFRVNGGNEKNTRALLNNSMVCTPTNNVWMYTFCHSQQLAEKNLYMASNSKRKSILFVLMTFPILV